jgi:hypothetical protein
MTAELLAMAQVVVHTGAIVVLFLLPSRRWTDPRANCARTAW